MKWIRVDTTISRHLLIHNMALALKITTAQALGHYTALCCGLGEHREDGLLSVVPDEALESWAIWGGRKGRLAKVLRAACQEPNGKMKGWWRQEKLQERAEKDRLRHRGASAEPPQKIRRASAVIPGANDTIRNGSSTSNEVELHLAAFEKAWKAYPRRPADSKSAARKAWMARINAGVPSEQLLDGVQRYAAYVKAEQIEPRHVKMASTFFGPNEHYLSDYTTDDPDRKIQVYTEDGMGFTPEFLRARGLPAPR